MEIKNYNLNLNTQGNIDIVDITHFVLEKVKQAKILDGIVTIFMPGATGAVTTLEYESGLEADFKKLDKNPIFSQMLWSIICNPANYENIELLKSSFDYFELTIYSMLEVGIGVMGNIKGGVEVANFHERVKAYEDEKNRIVAETKKRLNSKQFMNSFEDFSSKATKSLNNINKKSRDTH